jgi:hypothetical protein
VQIEYRLTYGDYRDLWHCHGKIWAETGAKPGCVRAMAPGMAVTVVFVLLYLMVLLPLQAESSWVKAASIAFVLGIFVGFGSLLVLGVLLRRRQRAYVRRLYESGPSRWIFGPRVLSLQPAGLTIEGESYRETIQWDIVWRIVMTIDHAFVYTSMVDAVIVPRRAFRTRQDFEEFVTLARQYHQRGLPMEEPHSTGITTSPPASAKGIPRSDPDPTP